MESDNMDKIKIGIMTMHCVPNYGAIMQAFATKILLDNRIKECKRQNEIIVKIVDFQPINKKLKYSDCALILYTVKNPKLIKSTIKLLFSKSRSISKKLHKYAYDFYLKNDVLSEEIYERKLCELENDYRALIIGSDQVWNPYGMEKNNPYLLGFSDKLLKYSFSSSFGIKEFPTDYEKIYKKAFLDFKMISVRENEGISIIRKLVNRDDCIQTLDPTLLLEKSEYQKFENNPKASSIKNGYVLVYMAMRSDTLLEFVLNNVSKNENIVILGMPEVMVKIKCNDPRVMILNVVTPEEFLGFFNLSKEVYTNSFHGIAFSIIYEKQMYIEYNDRFSKSNSRLENIVSMFGLENRIINSRNNCFINVDYEKINCIRKEKKKIAINYIEKLLWNNFFQEIN